MKTLVALLSCLLFYVANTSAKSPRTFAFPTDVTYAKAVRASAARAVAMFPDYDTEGTTLHQAVQDELEWQKKHNPAALDEPDWPERIAKACAAILGIEPVTRMQASK